MHTMDGQRVTKPKDTRRRHPDAFKQALIERSLAPGASVAAIAQEAGINANLLFNWRRLYRRSMAAASVQESGDPVLLPVTVVEPASTRATAASTSMPVAPSARAPVGTIEISIRGAVVRVRSTVDEASLRTVLRALADAA
jgi:transposase